MIVIIDSREHEGKNEHVLQYFRDNGIRYVNKEEYGNVALNAGDYMSGENPTITIDRKYGLQEVYCCVVGDHARFRDECIRARQNGKRLIILVEEPNITNLEDVERWMNPRYVSWCKLYQQHKIGKNLQKKQSAQPPLSSIQLADRMKVMRDRYGIEWKFCTREDCGKRIVEILSE